MSKWNKVTFVSTVKTKCEPRISNIIIDLINFAEDAADMLSWGRGEGYGTMTFKCKSEDYGLIPLFHITTNGQIKFPINLLRTKIFDTAIIINEGKINLNNNFGTGMKLNMEIINKYLIKSFSN